MTTAVAGIAATAKRAVGDVIAGRALRAFYAAVLGVALVGSTGGVNGWIGWATPFAFGAVLLAELGGVALSVFADRRRQKGERALFARLGSAGFAGFAIAVQLRGHADEAGNITSVGMFFAVFSAAGYGIYLLDSNAKRRDALRATGKLAEPPPVYGLYQWLRHPWLTARARRLAVTNAEARLVERLTDQDAGGPGTPTTPLLARAASLAAAADQVAAERRRAAIRGSLRRRIAAGVDPQMADIAVNTYDLDKVADGIATSADYPALTGLLTAELTPGRIAAGITARRNKRRGFRRNRPETVETVQETAPAALETAPTHALPAAPTAPAWPGIAPTGARMLPVRCARPAPAPEPVPAPALPAQRGLETVETDTEIDPTDPVTVLRAQADTDTDPAPALPAPPAPPEPPALPPIPPSLLPHLLKVMEAHKDWPLTITILGRHPDALTYAKIKAAAGVTGQQIAADVRTALLSLRAHPDAARAYVEANTPATVGA